MRSERGASDPEIPNESPVVVFQALSDSHIPAVIAACADWKELVAYGPPYWRLRSTAELSRKVAATSGPAPSIEYSYVATAEGALVGECSLCDIDLRNRVAQVGVCIWNPTDRGMGYGRAAAQHVIDWGIGYLGLVRLEAWIVDGNEPSLKLFESLGFAHEGTLRRRYLYAGAHHDMHLLALLA